MKLSFRRLLTAHQSPFLLNITIMTCVPDTLVAITNGFKVQ
jgi:hypothetical protein